MKNESSLRARTASSFSTSHSQGLECEMIHREPTGHRNRVPGLRHPPPDRQRQLIPHFAPLLAHHRDGLGALWPQRALSTIHLFSAHSLISPLDILWDFSQRWQLCFIPSSSSAAAAAAKSLQSCPTLCDPTDGSPPGFPISGILQARTLEWVAISFSNAWKWKVKVKSLSRVWLLATPWTAAYQVPPSWDFSGKSTGVGCHCLLRNHMTQV